MNSKMTLPNLDTNQKISRQDGLIAVPMDGDLVMMNISTGTYFGINPVGVMIWELLETPHTMAQICHHMMEKYAVDQETCLRDVRNFVEQMLRENIVFLA